MSKRSLLRRGRALTARPVTVARALARGITLCRFLGGFRRISDISPPPQRQKRFLGHPPYKKEASP